MRYVKGLAIFIGLFAWLPSFGETLPKTIRSWEGVDANLLHSRGCGTAGPGGWQIQNYDRRYPGYYAAANPSCTLAEVKTFSIPASFRHYSLAFRVYLDNPINRADDKPILRLSIYDESDRVLESRVLFRHSWTQARVETFFLELNTSDVSYSNIRYSVEWLNDPGSNVLLERVTLYDSTAQMGADRASCVDGICRCPLADARAQYLKNQDTGLNLSKCAESMSSGQILELLPIIYPIFPDGDHKLLVRKEGIFLRTQGTSSHRSSCYYRGDNSQVGSPDPNIGCATLQAAAVSRFPSSRSNRTMGTGAFVYLGSNNPAVMSAGIGMDHIIVDGNYAARRSIEDNATTKVVNGVRRVTDDGVSRNNSLVFSFCKGCRFTNGAVIRTMEYAVIIYNSDSTLFSGNTISETGQNVTVGTLAPSPLRLWRGDGIIAGGQANGLVITSNVFVDITDGAISINTGSRGSRISGNIIEQRTQYAVSGIVAYTGDWSNTQIDSNQIRGCSTKKCLGVNTTNVFDGAGRSVATRTSSNSLLLQGIVVGAHPWEFAALPPGQTCNFGDYQHCAPGPWGSGFQIRNNFISDANRGIVIDFVGRGVSVLSNRITDATSANGTFVSTLDLKSTPRKICAISYEDSAVHPNAPVTFSDNWPTNAATCRGLHLSNPNDPRF